MARPKKDSPYRVISLTLSTEINDIIDSIVKESISSGKRINKSQLIESMIYESLYNTYQLAQKIKKEENKEEIN